MSDGDGRYERMTSLYGNNGELVAALAMLAPEGNVRIALVNTIDFLASLDEPTLIDSRVIQEIIARGIVHLGFEIPGEAGEEPYEDMSELTIEDAVAQFRKQLDIDEEEDVD